MKKMSCFFFADTQSSSCRYALHVAPQHAVCSIANQALRLWMGVCIHQ